MSLQIRYCAACNCAFGVAVWNCPKCGKDTDAQDAGKLIEQLAENKVQPVDENAPEEPEEPELKTNEWDEAKQRAEARGK